MFEIKYILHAGPMVSKEDGDDHYITAKQLAGLYGVDMMNECVIATEDNREQARDLFPDAIHLFPRYDGKYEPIK